MRCSHCNKNEAESIVYLDYMGQKSELYLCGECMESMRQYVNGLYRQFRGDGSQNAEPQPEAEASAPFESPSESEPVPEPRAEGGAFPDDAGDAIRDRRQLAELRAKLRAAIQKEDYEQAAALRDEIAEVERINLERGVRR
jgi:protein-arginine kinase activator protein McsA